MVGSEKGSHPLLLGSEGSGRTTTLALFAADTVLSYCQRVLWICTDDRHRDQLVNGGNGHRGLEDWFERSNLRWGVKRAVGLRGPNSIASNQTEGVRTDLAFLTLAELANIHMELPGRYEDLFSDVGMVIIDDLDRLAGLDEQQAYWVLRRLNARLSQSDEQLVDTLWCASCSVVADGTTAWAEDLVGQDFDAIDYDTLGGMPQIEQFGFYLSEFIDTRRNPLKVTELIRWLNALKLPWHLRRCESSLRDLDLASAVSGSVSDYKKDNPAEAVVVILQGNYADAQREVKRLVHAGTQSGRKQMAFFMDVSAQEVSSLEVKNTGDGLYRLVESLPRAVSSRGNLELHKRQIDAVHVECWQVGDQLEDLFEKDPIRARQAEYGKELQTEPFIDFTKDRQGFRTRKRVHLASGRWRVEPFTPGTATRSAVTVMDRAGSKPLTYIDAAVADIHYYPGRIFLHPEGLFKVRDREKEHKDQSTPSKDSERPKEGVDLRRILVERIEEMGLSSPRKKHVVERLSKGRTDRISIGRYPVEVEELPVSVHTTMSGVDILDPVTLKVEERRRFVGTIPDVRYQTNAPVFLKFTEHMEPKGGALPVRLLAAAGRSILPLLMRGCEDRIEIDLLGDTDVPEGIALWETVPGGMGYLTVL